MKVLVADDHVIIRSGLNIVLEQIEEVAHITHADSGEQAYEVFCTDTPDIIFMDMNMPGIGGLEATRRIRARSTNAKIIIYSMHDNVSYAKQAFSAGASGYVLKSGNLSELHRALKIVDSGQRYLSHSVALKMALNHKNPIDTLTTREFEVLCLLAEGLAVKDIAPLLTISKKTVATYQTQLKSKLNVTNTVDLIKIAFEYDLIH